MTERALAVYVDPSTRHFLGDRLFEEDDEGHLNGDRQNAPYAHLRAFLQGRGVPVHTADRLPDQETGTLNVYFSMGRLENYPRLMGRRDVVLSGFFAMECPIVEPRLFRALPEIGRNFRRVLSWSDTATLERFTGPPVPVTTFRWPQSFDDVHEEIWDRRDRRFMVMINANKLPRIYYNELYTERLRAVEFFSRTGEIELYGKGWDRPSMRVGRTWVPHTFKRVYEAARRKWDAIRPHPLLVAARRVYRGPAESKREVLGQYTFALCFENSIMRGWITEKMFDCFFAGTVPVYWGAPEIADVVPADTFIDMRRFSGYAELRTHLKGLAPDEIRGYRERARAFLLSPAYRPFTRKAFTELFARMISEDSGRTLDGS